MCSFSLDLVVVVVAVGQLPSIPGSAERLITMAGDCMTKFKTFVRDELMLVLTLVGVALGIIFGMAIQAGTPSKMAVILLGFPGVSRRIWECTPSQAEPAWH